MFKKIAFVAVLVLFPGLAPAQMRIEVPYPVRFSLQENIRIICPVCQKVGERSTVMPRKCFQTSASSVRYIDEEGVIHLARTADMVCHYRCANGHFFEHSFCGQDPPVVTKKATTSAGGTISRGEDIEALTKQIK